MASPASIRSIASESCALDHLGATYMRELEPGEVVIIDSDGFHSSVWSGATGRRSLCVFELIYFARPDSLMDNQLVHSVRQELGAQLAREHPVEADLVIGIPGSWAAAAVGDVVSVQVIPRPHEDLKGLGEWLH